MLDLVLFKKNYIYIFLKYQLVVWVITSAVALEKWYKKADKGQVGSALHAMFWCSYTGCTVDACFFFLRALALVSPCCISQC